MRKFLYCITLVSLFLMTGCSKDDKSEPVPAEEIVFVDETLKDVIPETIKLLQGVGEVRFVNINGQYMSDVKKGTSYAVVKRGAEGMPEGTINMFTGRLPEDVLVTFSNPVFGVNSKTHYIMNVKADDSALALIEKVKTQCGESEFDRLNKTYEDICINTVNILKAHSSVFTFTFPSRNQKMLEGAEDRVYVFPASEKLDIVVCANESGTFKFVNNLGIALNGSEEFINGSEFSIPPHTSFEGDIVDENGEKVTVLVPQTAGGLKIYIPKQQ